MGADGLISWTFYSVCAFRLYEWVWATKCARFWFCLRKHILYEYMCGWLFVCCAGCKWEEKSTKNAECVHLSLHAWRLTERLNSRCCFSSSDGTMRWPTLRSRTRVTTTTCTAARSLPRWPSWCSITPNNRISCARGTGMSSNSSTHSTARTPPLRGADKLTN